MPDRPHRFADFAAQQAQAKRIVKALRAIGGYRATSRWSRVEFAQLIGPQLSPEDQEAAWIEYLSNEHGERWFYEPSVDRWEHE